MAMTKKAAQLILDREEEDHRQPLQGGPGKCRRCLRWLPESGHEEDCIVLRAMAVMGLEIIWTE